MFFLFLFRPGQAQHPAVLPHQRLAQVCVRRHHVGIHSDRRQLHGGAVCPTRRGIIPKVLQVYTPVRVSRFACLEPARSCCGPFPRRGEVAAPCFLQCNDCYTEHVNGVTGHRVEINALPLARITLVKL